jgi:subtilisin family serine protease
MQHAKTPFPYLISFLFVLLMFGCNKEKSPVTNALNTTVTSTLDSDVENFTSEPIANKYIVTLNAKALESVKRSPVELKTVIYKVANELFAKYPDLGFENSIDYVYAHSILGFAGSMTESTAVRMRNDPMVESIEQDMLIGLGRGDKGKPSGGGGSDPAQTTPYGITRVNGTTYTGNNVAWIIDTGIDPNHPDLNVDASRGFSAFTSGKDAGTNDGHGHGTHVSGTVAAIDNTIGVVGVAAGATVIPVKVLSSRGSGSNSGVIAGVDWVGQYGVSGDVANMSLGGGISTALDNAVVAASNRVKFALAAGNSSADANKSSPARANGTNIYTISACDVNDVFASFSNYGNPPIDYSAPGVSIYSTYKGGSYTTMSGTSMAAPHACGVLLLGTPTSSGTVTKDKDATPDYIISH